MDDELVKTTRTYQDAIVAARGLKTEDASNPEYDRALVELIFDLFGSNHDRDEIQKDLFDGKVRWNY